MLCNMVEFYLNSHPTTFQGRGTSKAHPNVSMITASEKSDGNMLVGEYIQQADKEVEAFPLYDIEIPAGEAAFVPLWLENKEGSAAPRYFKAKDKRAIIQGYGICRIYTSPSVGAKEKIESDRYKRNESSNTANPGTVG